MNDEQSQQPNDLQADNRLDHLRVRPERQIDTQRSSVVRFLRYALPGFAVLMALILFLWPIVQNNLMFEARAPLEQSHPDIKQAQTENRLVEARYESITEEGLPFTVASKEAVQKKDNPNVVVMDEPKATLDLGADDLLELTAVNGTFDQVERLLDLEGDVRLKRSDGTVLTTKRVSANIKEGTAKSVDPVNVTGPDGEIEATGLVISNRGSDIIFTGPARLVLYTKSNLSASENGL